MKYLRKTQESNAMCNSENVLWNLIYKPFLLMCIMGSGVNLKTMPLEI